MSVLKGALPQVRAARARYVKTVLRVPQVTGEDHNYIRSGAVDSLSLLRFCLVLEEAYSITLTEEDVSNPSFATIGGVLDLIERKYHER